MDTTHRDFLMLTGGTIVATNPVTRFAAGSVREEVAEISAVEDLMREHGVLGR